MIALIGRALVRSFRVSILIMLPSAAVWWSQFATRVFGEVVISLCITQIIKKFHYAYGCILYRQQAIPL